MFKSILVPLDLADTDLAKPAIATAATLSQTWHGAVRLLNVMPMTPVMLAEYVPADFDAQQRKTSEEALSIIVQAGVPNSGIGVRPYNPGERNATLRLHYPLLIADAGPCVLQLRLRDTAQSGFDGGRAGRHCAASRRGPRLHRQAHLRHRQMAQG